MLADNHRLPTPIDRTLLRALEAQWDEYRRALHSADQAVFDRLVEYARVHADANGKYADSSSGQTHQFVEQQLIDPALVSILIEQQKQLDDLEDRLDYIEADLNDDG